MWALSPAELLLSSVLEYLLAQLYLMFCDHSCTTHQPGHHFGFSASPEGWGESWAGKSFLWPGYWPFYPTVQLVPGVKPLPCCISLGKSHSLRPPSGIPWGSRPKNTAEVQTHGKQGPLLCPGRCITGKTCSASGYLREGPTQGEVCPCQECPHFIYSPSLT